MRARLALAVSGVTVELREVVLRDKPAQFLAASQSGTVPCLVADDCTIDESLDIMIWALRQNDPEGWLDMPEQGFDLIAYGDGPFKNALDRTKYASRYPEEDPVEHREIASLFLSQLNNELNQRLYAKPTLADFALLPFVRQFAFIDKAWFDAQEWPALHAWLERFIASERFLEIMTKYPQWCAGDLPIEFPTK